MSAMAIITSPLAASKVPNLDLLSYIFGQDESKDTDDPIYINPDNPDEEFMSKKSARSLLKRLVAGFKANGLKQGDVVCMYTTNNIYHPIVCLAAAAAGGIWTAINPALTPDETKRHLTKSESKFLFCSPGEIFEKGLKTATLSCGIPSSRVFILDNLSSLSSTSSGSNDTNPNSSNSWTQLLKHGSPSSACCWTPFDSEDKAKQTTICLYPTSGTSGAPKLAMLSHHNLVSGDYLVHQIEPQPHEIRSLILWPLFHASALVFTHVTPFSGRRTYIPHGRFAPDRFLDHISRFQINNTSLAPAMMLAVLHLPVPSPERKRENLKSLRYGMCASSPLSAELAKAWRGILPEECPWNNVYGLTETTGVVTKTYYPEFDNDEGSVGGLLPGCEAKIIPIEDGESTTTTSTTSANQQEQQPKTGELLLKGPNIFQGYFRDPEATAQAFDSEGFMYTGDVAYVGGDKKKKIFLVDRKKELIKVRGFQVAPAELEGILMGHPAVTEAAVIGVRVRNGEDELPRAYVVLSPSSSSSSSVAEAGGEEEKNLPLLAEDIKKFLRARLVSYKALTGGVRFLDALPRNGNNKVLKRELRDLAAREGEKAKL